MPHCVPRVHRVPIATTFLGAVNGAVGFEVRKNFLDGPIRDSNPLRNFEQADVGIICQAQEHERVVG